MGEILEPVAIGYSKGLGQLQREHAFGATDRGLWLPPKMIQLPNTTVVKAFDSAEITGLGRTNIMVNLILQNHGLDAVKWAVDFDMADTNGAQYHGILAACNGVEDGLGSIQTFRAFAGKLFLKTVTGASQLSLAIIYAQ